MPQHESRKSFFIYAAIVLLIIVLTILVATTGNNGGLFDPYVHYPMRYRNPYRWWDNSWMGLDYGKGGGGYYFSFNDGPAALKGYPYGPPFRTDNLSKLRYYCARRSQSFPWGYTYFGGDDPCRYLYKGYPYV